MPGLRLSISSKGAVKNHKYRPAAINEKLKENMQSLFGTKKVS